MDVAVSWLVIIGPLLIGLASTIWYGSGRTPALWIGFTGAVLLFLAGALQCQQWIWKSSNLAPQAQAQEKQMPADNPKQPVISGRQHSDVWSVWWPKRHQSSAKTRAETTSQ